MAAINFNKQQLKPRAPMEYINLFVGSIGDLLRLNESGFAAFALAFGRFPANPKAISQRIKNNPASGLRALSRVVFMALSPVYILMPHILRQ